MGKKLLSPFVFKTNGEPFGKQSPIGGIEDSPLYRVREAIRGLSELAADVQEVNTRLLNVGCGEPDIPARGR